MVNVVQIHNELGEIEQTTAAEMRTQAGRDAVAKQLHHDSYEELLAAVARAEGQKEAAKA